VGDPAMSIGLGTAFDERPMYGHGNFWFGITPSALRAMLPTARFEVVDERQASGRRRDERRRVPGHGPAAASGHVDRGPHAGAPAFAGPAEPA
jgi:hypothetical protein